VPCPRQDYTKVPGEIPTFLGFKPDDPEVFKSKQLKELKNGRALPHGRLRTAVAMPLLLRPPPQ
jgi:hypothetical protein